MTNRIHPTAVVMEGAELASGCTVGPFSVIGSAARIGKGTQIGSHCELGVYSGVLPPSPLIIGERSLIRSGCVFYQSSEFGAGLRTGHHVTVREGISAGIDLQIGTASDLQGHCRIGNHVRLHSKVFVSQSSVLGNFVWLFPSVVLTNDIHPPSEEIAGVTIDDFAAVAAKSTILPGCRVGEGALVGAMTLVREDVPPGAICLGVPGRIVGHTSRIRLRSSGKLAYPWRRHFHRGYPTELVAAWKAEFPEG